MGARKGIGELLVRENLIDINQLERARQEQRQTGGRLTSSLVQLGFVKDKELAEFMGRQYNLPTIDLYNFEIDPEAVKLVSAQLCRRHMVIPVQKSGRSLVVAFSDPSNLFIKDDLGLLTRCKIEVVIASEHSINAAIEKHFGASAGAKMDTLVSQIEESHDNLVVDSKKNVMTVDAEVSAEDGPIIGFVNAMLSEAIKMKASDIHVELYEKKFRIRFRLDGELMEIHQPPQNSAAAIVSRLKILSKMDIAERRKPQDGRMKVKLKSGQEIDFRVNSLPTLFGEKIVMRLLDKSNLQVDLTKLGMEDQQLDLLKKALALPQGMILITGPTGSGKTTTVYSALGALNTVDVNISTAEDPVEFNFEGINQVHVNPEIGFGFPEALRAFLRQDPEIIMVGEIRDLETASIAYKAAATGHLVISTLHTNDTATTVNRLISMGVANYLVAESTSLVVAQRLIKKICNNCITEARVSRETLLEIGVLENELPEYTSLRRGEGCEKCNGSGLSGRMAIFEVLNFSAAVKDAIFSGGSTLDIKRQAVSVDKMITLRRAALIKLKQGITSVEEVIAGTVGDDL
ncbi:MAG: type IV-A pilus assembly ATPase PilB [Bdellovibrionales bacterium RBG_16_40_8]|nr:MAG: type IV-A pilus assembly ATPase PilB [Bdellovibrionales bacterium RBG_16_40_8]